MKPVLTRLKLPLEPLLALTALQRAGFVAYLVGGAVRDLLLAELYPANQSASSLNQLEKWSKIDFDLTTNAKPDEILSVFPGAFLENAFGTVSLTYQQLWTQFAIDAEYQRARQTVHQLQTRKVDPKLIDLARATKIHHSLLDKNLSQLQAEFEKPVPLPLLEITTFRGDEHYDNQEHRPSALRWGGSLVDDLKRRDFTLNALALKLDGDALTKIVSALPQSPPTLQGFSFENTQFQLIDHHHGEADLKARLIRTVGDAEHRLAEDPLRLLRAIRFAVQLDCSLESTLEANLTRLAPRLKLISWERISTEFLKILASPQPKRGLLLLEKTGLLAHILPELLLGQGVDQAGHHTTDVWTHSLDALEACPSPDPIVRLATLLHDIAKPQTLKLINDKPTFYNHEVVGARLAKSIATRLRLSKRDIERIFILVRYHMFHYQPENSDASIRRFMRQVGLENIDDILELREADRLGSGARKTSWRLEEMKERLVAQLHQPLAVTDLALNGHDLMKAFDLKPGPEIGRLLNKLFEMVLESPELNTREILLTHARNILAPKE